MNKIVCKRERKIKSLRHSKKDLTGQKIEHKKKKEPEFFADYGNNPYFNGFVIYVIESEPGIEVKGDFKLHLTKEMYEMVDRLRLGLEYEYGVQLSIGQTLRSIIIFMHEVALDITKIKKGHERHIFIVPLEDRFYDRTRFDELLRVPSVITSMFPDIEAGSYVIHCDKIEDDIIHDLMLLRELLNLGSLDDLIRLFIFRILSTTDLYYDRFPAEMEVLLDPLFLDLNSFMKDPIK